MCIRLRSCPPVEGKEKKIKKRGSRRVIVLTVITALFFLSILCWTGTYLRNRTLNEYGATSAYQTQAERVVLELEDGVNVELLFGDKGVKIKDAYRVATLRE